MDNRCLKDFASYSEDSKNEWVDEILKKVQSLQALAHTMSTYLAMTDWHLFLTTIKKETLFKIVLDIDLDALRTEDKNTNHFQHTGLLKADEMLINVSKKKQKFMHEKQLRAFVICLLAAYKISHREDFGGKSNTGYYIGYWFLMAFPKGENSDAADVFHDFVLSGLPLSLYELEKYLKRKNKYEKYWGLLTSPKHILFHILQMAIEAAQQFKVQELHLESVAN